MKKLLVLNLLNFFDFFHKKKIIKFFKKNKICTDIIFDIGGHVGESVKFFTKNFIVKTIYSFEPIINNFNKLDKVSDSLEKKYNIKIVRENYGCGKDADIVKISQLSESSSSTIKKINFNSKYFKTKDYLLNLKTSIQPVNIRLIALSDYIKNNGIKKIDLLKIDTEGFELEVLLGLKNYIGIVQCIIFEHHYDDMIEKKYTFSDINNFLIKNKFEKIFKLKMYFRKTFDYIYFKKY